MLRGFVSLIDSKAQFVCSVSVGKHVTHLEADDLDRVLAAAQTLRQAAQLLLQALQLVLQAALLQQHAVHPGVDLHRQALNLLVVGLQCHRGLLQLLLLLLDLAGQQLQLVEGVVENVQLLEDVVDLRPGVVHKLPQAVAQVKEAIGQAAHVIHGGEAGLGALGSRGRWIGRMTQCDGVMNEEKKEQNCRCDLHGSSVLLVLLCVLVLEEQLAAHFPCSDWTKTIRVMHTPL